MWLILIWETQCPRINSKIELKAIYYAILSCLCWFLPIHLLLLAYLSDAKGSMPSKKILLVKRLPEETLASFVALGETGFSWQSYPNAADLAATLKKEDFSLLFFDHRGVPGEPFAFIESVRDTQKKIPLFLICETLEMVSVIQAIRLGVKDYFQPPQIGRAHV